MTLSDIPPIAVIRMGYATKTLPGFPQLNLGEGDVKEHLSSPKAYKFMGKPDALAVVALGRALNGLAYDGKNTGLYMAVGYVPFDKDALLKLARLSCAADGTFSMQAFTDKAIRSFNPVLSFRCLPNMPIYHTSANFGIQGPAYVTYPTIGEFYQCVEEAIRALDEGKVELALVGGCGEQENFLATHRLDKFLPYGMASQSGAAFLALELLEKARQKAHPIHYTLESLSLSYDPGQSSYAEFCNDAPLSVYLGPASLGLFLNTGMEVLHHRGTSFYGCQFQSQWRSWHE